MRIVHTSDWHAGRRWRGVDRLPELRAVLDHLAGWLDTHDVDLLLVTGDVFDTGAPPPDAERCVFEFFRRIGAAGVKAVVIAGNHDNARRLEAWGHLTELVDVHALGRPRRPQDGGVRTVTTRSGERAVVAALPFAGVRDLVSALQLAGQPGEARTHYAERLYQMARMLCREFQDDAVNVLMAHTHLEGALFSGSERAVHVGDEWAAMPQQLPVEASYIALGHIHRPQEVVGSPAPAHYAGSPLQLDFGEAGEEKSFVVIDAGPGLPAQIRRVPYEGGQPLRDVRGTLAEIEEQAEELQGAGWLRITVPLAAPDPDVGSRVRALLPNAVVVKVELPEREEARDDERPSSNASAATLYRAFFKRRHGDEPPEQVIKAFEALHREMTTP